MPSVVRLTTAGLAAAAVIAGAAGCTDIDEASAASITRGGLASAMAGQFAAGSGITYTATYQVGGDGSATITRAQSPTRTAYIYPGGRLVTGLHGTIRCTGDTAPTCTESDPDPAAAAALADTRLVTPEAAQTMLNAAALDPDAIATPHDTTVAGRHANCLELSKVDGTLASAFTVCVTNEGALASFSATIKGEHADMALTAYSDKVTDPDVFITPRDAKVTSKRAKFPGA
ncbi:hypothetical protein HH310_07665 [Actinoplanes sp. TBRC 11911]|uniref:hypothetical protein n=1 Tax=Actinoplanes sp. TBRC 11911 TaxID=2729386 RepID=UPI00145C6C8C|nr:hypothetical protein [Actinoplanes sp. TBRC 11911]NMO51065.1 hypothetical protein [Actinoplanes sp. TBRC 11911]